MHSVFLIDDEPWAIESLIHVLNLPAHGFSRIERFSHAPTAWEALVHRPPDVAFVDIRMPELDGLTLVRRAAGLGLPTLFVVISAHEEFTYAQEAIRTGVCDYCVKPLERKEAAALMEKIRQRLTITKAASNAALCEDILSGQSAKALFERQGLRADSTHWQALIFRFVNAEAHEAIGAALSGFPHLLVELGDTKVAAIVHGDRAFPERLHPMLHALCQAHPRLLIGVSRPTRHPERMAGSISQAQGCAYHDFIDPGRRLVCYQAAESAKLLQLSQQLAEAIAQRSSAWFDAKLSELLALAHGEGLQMHALVRCWNALMDTFEQSACTPEVLGEIEHITEPDELRALLSDLPSMLSYLRALMEQYLREGAPRSTAVNESFLEMLEYVHANFCKRLRLSDLATRFHLNMAYTSELFRKVVGMTYTDYLTKLRMERAKQMIATREKTLTEIALSVGYGDYFTFSKRFKQFFGISPSQAAE